MNFKYLVIFVLLLSGLTYAADREGIPSVFPNPPADPLSGILDGVLGSSARNQVQDRKNVKGRSDIYGYSFLNESQQDGNSASPSFGSSYDDYTSQDDAVDTDTPDMGGHTLFPAPSSVGGNYGSSGFGNY